MQNFIKKYSTKRNRIGVVELPKVYAENISNVVKDYLQQNIMLAGAHISNALLSTNRQKAIKMAKLKDGSNKSILKPHTIEYNEIVSAAYCAIRTKMSFGPLFNVFRQITLRRPDFNPTSILDFGSGPGTAIWAASDNFPKLDKIVAVESSSPMREMFKKLNGNLPSPIESLPIKKQYLPSEQYDLVVASLVLSELPDDSARSQIVDALWKQTKDILVLLDGGGVFGSNVIKSARQQIIDTSNANGIKMHIVTPCPHEYQCPIQEKQWCHFSQKVRNITCLKKYNEVKLESLDSKFSFVVFQKSERKEPNQSMLIQPPLKRQKRVIIDLCTSDGEITRTFLAKTHGREVFKDARKSYWGDLWPHPLPNVSIKSNPNARENKENETKPSE